MKTLKNLFLGLGFALSLSHGASAFAQTKLLYLVPNGVSPNGNFALAAFAKKTKIDDWESDVAFYFTKISANGTLKIASDAVFEWGSDQVDFRGYGPKPLAWSNAFEGNEEEPSSEYVLVNNQSRKSNDLAFLRLVDGKYLKQSYNEEKYRDNVNAALEQAKKTIGNTDLQMVHTIGDTSVVSEIPKNSLDIKPIKFEEDFLDLNFEEPIYVVSNYEYTLLNEETEQMTFLTVVGVVKIARDKAGNLIDSAVSFTTEITEGG
jgi:hypothetical protein